MGEFTRLLAAAAATAAIAGCVARYKRPAVDLPEVLRQTRAVVDAGCYRCLREAERLPPSNAPLRPRRLEVLALLAARVRELGLQGEPSWIAGRSASSRR